MKYKLEYAVCPWNCMIVVEPKKKKIYFTQLVTQINLLELEQGSILNYYTFDVRITRFEKQIVPTVAPAFQNYQTHTVKLFKEHTLQSNSKP